MQQLYKLDQPLPKTPRLTACLHSPHASSRYGVDDARARRPRVRGGASLATASHRPLILTLSAHPVNDSPTRTSQHSGWGERLGRCFIDTIESLTTGSMADSTRDTGLKERGKYYFLTRHRIENNYPTLAPCDSNWRHLDLDKRITCEFYLPVYRKFCQLSWLILIKFGFLFRPALSLSNEFAAAHSSDEQTSETPKLARVLGKRVARINNTHDMLATEARIAPDQVDISITRDP